MSTHALGYFHTPHLAPLAVSFRLILGLYCIIPICFLLSQLDFLFWNNYLLNNLPSSPKHFILFQILFGTPHIIASTIILGSNSDYLAFFKKPIISMSALIALVFGLGSLIVPYKTLYLITVFLTVFHVLKQQHGIAKGICRLSNRTFYCLLTISILAGISIYLGIFLKNSFSPSEALLIERIAASLCVALLIATLLTHKTLDSNFGKLFMWGNSFLVFSSFYFYVHHYYFLAILIPRLVHDATAYIFYVTHDYNRHRAQPKNLLYQLAQRCNIHIFIVLPALSFGLTFLLQRYGDHVISTVTLLFFNTEVHKAVSLGLIGYLSLMHYYTEALTWKQGSPYRQYIKFKQ